MYTFRTKHHIFKLKNIVEAQNIVNSCLQLFLDTTIIVKKNPYVFRKNNELNQRLLERNKQYDKLLAEVDAVKKQKNRLSMEREKIVYDFKKTSADKTLKDETSRLQGELNKLNIENAGLRKEVDRIRTR